MKTSIFAFLTLLLTTTAWAKYEFNYSYTVHLPAIQATCEDEAKSLQTAIEQNANIKNSKVVCLSPISITENGKTFQLFSLRVNYSAEFTLPYVADFKANQLNIPEEIPFPAYSSYEQCASDLEKQKSHFEQETKLKAVIVSCERVEFSLDPLYATRIEGFGKPQKKLQYVDLGISPTLDTLFFSEIEKLITDQKIQIIKKFEERIAFFYAEKDTSLQYVSKIRFNKIEDCKAQLEEGKSILTKSGSTKSIGKCLPANKYVEMLIFGIGSKRHSTPYAWKMNSYYSFAECMQDRKQVLAKYPEGTVFGFICLPDILNDDRYVGNLFR